MSSNSNSSNNRRGRGGRRGGRGGRGNNATSNGTVRSSPAAPNGSANSNKAAPTPDTTSADSDEMICWICAEPVKFYALSECNHRTCHVCALRLRALYKRTDSSSSIGYIHNVSDKGLLRLYAKRHSIFRSKLQISFETKEMMEDTMILLRFNCPDADCDVIAQGWGDLKWHVKEKHDSILCDLCIRHKKIFAHEHTLYSPVTFSLHMHRSILAGSVLKKKLTRVYLILSIQCVNFVGNAPLVMMNSLRIYESITRNASSASEKGSETNSGSLNNISKSDIIPAPIPHALEQKFVVFATQLDLQGHQVDVHGEQMSSRDRRDARRVDLAFSSGTRGGRGRGGRVQVNETTESRAREPPAQATTQPPPQPGPPPGRGSRRAAFGASLTVGGPSAQNGSPASQQGPPRPPPSRTPDPDVDPETLEQHNQFLINGLVPLFDEEKRGDILNAWNGMKIEQRDQFPSLTPTSLGSGFADIASGRVLNVKHSTRSSGSRAGSSSRSTGAVWDRVERVAAGLGGPTPALQSSAAPKPIKPNPFPPLGGGAGGGTSRSGASSSSTPWSGSATTQSSQHIIIAPARAPEPVKNNAGRPPPITSSSAFPELPSSSASRAAIPKMSGNQSLKRITGESPALGSVWGGGSENNTPTIEEPAPATNAGGKGKKKKGKETLFTLGSFPN
ncbi:zinc finger protein [Rhizoctonia solani]|uniref:Zinc finger protein n=1 Tax=Rhizoctonia solani TaxID=456999 RepID=A0A8H7IB04_9AGAM|nr:zinc finger protein [Rhizoctonia solani]